MRIVLMASGEFALPTLRWLSNDSKSVALVVTQPARPKGRGKKLTPTPVAQAARTAGLPVMEVEDVNAPDVVRSLQATAARLALVIAFGQKLGPNVLGAFPSGCVNLHASLLPRHRGAAPIQAAILGGDEQTGVSVFRIVERMDAGPVLITRSTMIKPEETADELHDRLAAIGVDAVKATFELFEGGAEPPGVPQDETQSTKAPKLRKEHGLLHFDRPAAQVARHVRAMWSWPGASARFESASGRWENVQVARVHMAEPRERPSIAPGTLDARLYAACTDGFVELLEIKPASGPRMGWREYVNGRRVQPGDRFTLPA